MNTVDEAFYYLGNNGQRFIKNEDQNSLLNGMYKNDFGVVNGYTIAGMKELAGQGKLIFDDLPLTPEEVEIIFNYIKFKRTLK